MRRFYEEVAADPVLRPVYPTQDLGPAEEHLRLFLIQYWGGPPTYNELRGHPRLRMRHVRFHIGETERDLWLKHMRTALDELALPAPLDAQLWDYLVMAAHSLVNAVPERHARAGGARRPGHHARVSVMRSRSQAAGVMPRCPGGKRGDDRLLGVPVTSGVVNKWH